MSSDGSVNTTSTRLRQFGLYRSIDARTEEFLRLSRKRQMKQGCACAAISTAVTVIVVIIVLLICEYMIVVETNTVQKMKNVNSGKKILQDLPVADKLDRSDFGFDQDYFERMPLLLNALQDNSYIDPTAEMSVLTRRNPYSQRSHRIQATAPTPRKAIRKTSPQPFLFEYRSPYPRPFRKTVGVANSWTESYHNAQRLKNLNDVVKYLENTLNAKFGDLYVPSESQIAFSSLYVAPTSNQKYTNSEKIDITSKGSKFDHHWNHHSDPLFSFKPDNPSDVNFLVDDAKLYFISRNKNIARSPNLNDSVNKCIHKECTRYDTNKKDTKLVDYNRINSRLHDDTDIKRNIDPNNIYFTTSRPLVQFRRKTLQPASRHLFENYRPKYVRKESNHLSNQKNQIANVPQVILHLNVYSVKGKNENKITTTTNEPKDNLRTTPMPYEKYPRTENVNNLEINATGVEDFHVGSSGIIPINTQPSFPNTYLITTPIVPPFSATEQVTIIPSTNPPEILKFNPEDAKIPDQYLNLRKSDTFAARSPNLRELDEKNNENQAEDAKTREQYNNLRKSDISEMSEITTDSSSYRQFEDNNYEKTQAEEKLETLVIKLKNSISSTTQEYRNTGEEDNKEVVTETYVPQLNGHYRNMKYKNLSTLLKESSERYRRRLENLMFIKKPTYVPMFPDDKKNDTDLLH